MFIPEHFRAINYNGENYPGSGKVFADGANCQVYAYEFLRYHRLEAPNFRSSELWEDQKFTYVAMSLQPLDLILLNSTEQVWGAHVVVYLGQELILHLSKENKLPKIEYLGDLQKNPKYRCYIGTKTVLRSGKSPAKNQQLEKSE